MKRILLHIIFVLCIPMIMNTAQNDQDNTKSRVYYTGIKPGVREILIGTTLKDLKQSLKQKYKINLIKDNANIFPGNLTIESFITRFSPVLEGIRAYRNWTYNRLLKFLQNKLYKSFLEPVSKGKWLTTDFPLKFKRWKKYRIMLKNFNPFVRRADLAFYRGVLYYARFYVVDRYSFNDTYLPKNEERFMRHLYKKFKRLYGSPILYNNYQYHWRDNEVELALNGKNSTLTFTDLRTDRLVVRYLKNVVIVLSRMQNQILHRADYIDKHLRDFE